MRRTFDLLSDRWEDRGNHQDLKKPGPTETAVSVHLEGFLLGRFRKDSAWLGRGSEFGFEKLLKIFNLLPIGLAFPTIKFGIRSVSAMLPSGRRKNLCMAIEPVG